MEQKCLLVLIFISSFYYLASANEAPFINKCKAEDSKCIRDAAQAAIPLLAAGIPSLGVDSLDPMIIDKVDASSPNLKLELTSLKITGLKGCVAKKVKRDIAKSKIFIKIVCSVEINGFYNMSGQLLILPIEGHGKVKSTIRKAVFTVDSNMDFNVQKPDGKTHWYTKDWKHKFELEDKSTIKFENLFNGNEVFARAAQEVVDSSSNEIILEVCQPVTDAILKKIIDTIQQFYDAVPGENLALE